MDNTLAIITKKAAIFDILTEVERHQVCIQQLLKVKDKCLTELSELQKAQSSASETSGNGDEYPMLSQGGGVWG